MNCDKCSKRVAPQNDATRLEAIRTGNGLYMLLYSPRHLLPVEGCEGSPSRAQYLGGPPDTRQGHELDPGLVPAYRAAYATMLEE